MKPNTSVQVETAEVSVDTVDIGRGRVGTSSGGSYSTTSSTTHDHVIDLDYGCAVEEDDNKARRTAPPKKTKSLNSSSKEGTGNNGGEGNGLFSARRFVYVFAFGTTVGVIVGVILTALAFTIDPFCWRTTPEEKAAAEALDAIAFIPPNFHDACRQPELFLPANADKSMTCECERFAATVTCTDKDNNLFYRYNYDLTSGAFAKVVTCDDENKYVC